MNSTNSVFKNHDIFPQKLMNILSNGEFEDIISWMPDGKSFSIRNKDSLISVLRKYNFQETKFDSFRRKLHRWGFKVVKKGIKDTRAYHHRFFLRDDPTRCLKMKSRTQRPTNMALKKKYDTSTKVTDKPKVIDLQNDVEKNSFTKSKGSDVKPQNICFDQYVEKMHNDYWLKRKHLIQKYYSFSNVNIQPSPSQSNKKISNLSCSRQLFHGSPSSINIKSTIYIERGNDLLDEKYGRLALKKKIKRRKDKDTSFCNKNFHQYGFGEYNCNINRRNRVVSASA